MIEPEQWTLKHVRHLEQFVKYTVMKTKLPHPCQLVKRLCWHKDNFV